MEGHIGCVLAVMVAGMPDGIYFKVGLIAIVGLSAKNAILIIEFAKDNYAEGKPLLASAIDAAKLRFRPVIMTSLAFKLEVCHLPSPQVPVRPARTPSALRSSAA
jgi:multidrug efflux pump